MINVKLAVISAALGLILSFLIGLMNHISIGYMIMRAIISAVLMGGIAAGASFIFRKFLADEQLDAGSVQGASSAAGSAGSAGSTGNLVDITLKVDEDVLPDTDNAPQFYVSPEAGMRPKPLDVYKNAAINASSRQSASSRAAASSEGSSQFVAKPLVSADTPQFSVVPEAAPGMMPDDVFPEIKKEPAPKKQDGASGGAASFDEAGSGAGGAGSGGIEGLDELPDLSDVTSGADEDVADIISDSAFATAANPEANYSVGPGAPDVKIDNDSQLIADTIRTLLKNEG